MKEIQMTLLFLVITGLTACSTQPNNHNHTSSEAEEKTGRILVINGEQSPEINPEQIVSWKCSEYGSEGRTIVELGYAQIDSSYRDMPEYKELSEEEREIVESHMDTLKKFGFVLYDGTNTGDVTFYSRQGLNHRWDWRGDTGEDSGLPYSFVIKPDGTGLFYDFTGTEDGESIEANDVYECRK